MKKIALVFLVVWLGFAGNSWAGCTQADLATTWYYYAFGVGLSSNGIEKGYVTVDTSGNVTGGAFTQSSGGSGTFTGGSIKLFSTTGCTVKGTLTSSLGTTSTIEGASFSNNKELWFGQIRYSNGEPGFFTAFRR